MKLLHYSKDKIDKLKEMEYSQKSRGFFQGKPDGLWVSVGKAWKEWCEAEEFSLEKLEYKYEVILNENANIIYLNNENELFDFTLKYRLKTKVWLAEYDADELDWARVRKEYQGILIPKYLWECRLARESLWYYGWDCASGCIWDLKCVKEFNMIEKRPPTTTVIAEGSYSR